MNKIYLSLLGTLLCVLPCKSQTLVDGRTWNYAQKMYGDDDYIERTYTVKVSGDAVVNGQSCKRLVTVYQDTPNDSTVSVAFEKDSKVYEIHGEDAVLRWDFSLGVGDKADDFGTVVSVDTIGVGNVKYKRITIGYDREDNYKNYLVEGIGLSSTKNTSYIANSYYEVLVSVYQDGECIFKDSDFAGQATGIDSKLQTEEKSNPTLYDLSGRQILVPQKGHVYIKGNKKVLQ